MHDDEWDDAAAEIAALLQMQDDMATICLWRQSFESRDYSRAELVHGARLVAERGTQGSGKRWRSDVLNVLLRVLSDRRFARVAAERDEQDRKHASEMCQACSGSGLVIVPHPGSVRDDEWLHPWPEAGVSCRCYRGLRLASDNCQKIAGADEKKGKPARLWTIAEYEGRNPAWELQVRERDLRRKSEREARLRTAAIDKQRGPLSEVVRKAAIGLLTHAAG